MSSCRQKPLSARSRIATPGNRRRNAATIGLTFSTADYKFYEVFRTHDDNRFMRSAPSFLPEARSIVGSEDFARDADGAQIGAERGLAFKEHLARRLAGIDVSDETAA